MRYFLPVLLLVSCKLSAQYVDLSWQPSFYCQPAEIIPYGGEWFVIAKTYNNKRYESGGYAALINDSGIQREQYTNWTSANGLYNAAVNGKGQLAWSGSQGSCDFYTDSAIATFNSNGEQIKLLQNGEAPHSVYHIAGLPEGHFVTNGLQGTILLDSALNIKHSNYPTLARDIKSNGDSIVWFHTRSFIPPYPVRLHRRIYRGDLLSPSPHSELEGFSSPDYVAIRDFHASGPQICAIIDSTIWTSEYPFTTSQSKEIVWSGVEYQHIQYYERHYYLFGMDASNRTWMQKRSADLNTWENFLLPWDAYLWDVAIQEGTIALLGDRLIPDGGRFPPLSRPASMPNGGAANLIAFRTIPLEDFATAETDADIAIHNIIWSGEYSILEPPIICYGEDGSFGIVTLSGFSIEVLNKGSVPVSGVSVSTRRRTCGDFRDPCGTVFGFWFPFTEVTIPPGGSATLPIDEEMQFFLQDLEPPYELCFWATAHGAPTEHTYQDNLLCTNLDIHKGAPPEPSWRVSPNPAEHWVDITLPSGLDTGSELLLYHSNGQILRRSTLNPGTLKHRFALEQLPTGLYIIVWLHGDTQNVKRFIKAP